MTYAIATLFTLAALVGTYVLTDSLLKARNYLESLK